MIRVFEGIDIHREPWLRDQMLFHRADQFNDRMRWGLKTDAFGREVDEFDALRPTYIVCSGSYGEHLGSLRLLPTTGPTMVSEIFPELMPREFAQEDALECTRFCTTPDAPRHISAALFLATLDYGMSRGLAGSYGIFNDKMLRVYKALGTPAEVVTSNGEIHVGWFAFDPALRPELARKARGEELHIKGRKAA